MQKARYAFRLFGGMLLMAGAHAMPAHAVKPDLVPMPKQYAAAGGWFDAADVPLWMEPDNRQCEIAVREISGRIREFGGTPGAIANAAAADAAGIYVLTADDPAALRLAREFDIKISDADPGPQGYIIHTASNRLAVIGSDNVGALYGAMTLCQMLTASATGKVGIHAARVYDKPDYRYREGMSVDRGLGLLAVGETGDAARLSAYQAGIDRLMRFKINRISDYLALRNPAAAFQGPDGAEKKRKVMGFYRAVNDYAVERGFYPVLDSIFTCVASVNVKAEEPLGKDWDCVRDPGGNLFCWSRDDLARKRIQDVLEICRLGNFKALFLHPVDGGGDYDPELWSKRCPACRKLWADDERWKASAHQFNLWAELIRAQCPELMFEIAIYPYVASCVNPARATKGVDAQTYKQNTVDYWRQLHAKLDPLAVPIVWLDQPALMARYRALFQGRPVAIYAHSINDCGYFGTWHRYNKSNYIGNPRDVFMLTGGHSRREIWMNNLCDVEFSWNTEAPGAEVFTGLYYDMDRDHTGPKEIIEDWVPRACRALYGREVGDRIAPVYQAGVLPLYIQDPGKGIYQGNKYRRWGTADLDPTRKPEQTPGMAVAPDMADSPERMAAQVAATQKAMDALESALPHMDTLDKYLRKSFMTLYRRMPLWHMIARARFASYEARRLQRQGRAPAAAAVLEQGLQTLETDWSRARKILDETSRQKAVDLMYFGPLDRRGDVKPGPDELKAMLLDQIASAKILLRPRRPGPVLKVALYKGLGVQGTLEYLADFTNVQADVIASLSLAVLDQYDCVFMLQTTSLDNQDYLENLRRYVEEGGGGVLFQHDLCGLRRGTLGEATPFPEICTRGERQDGDTVTITREHPALPGLGKDAQAKLMYYDHVVPAPGSQGAVLVTDDQGRPVVLAGEAGSGKVIFDGSINLASKTEGGSGFEERKLFGFNAALTRGAIEWFTGVRLQAKE